MKDDRITLTLIVRACEKIHLYMGAISESEFLANDEKQSATIMQLIVIGEIAKQVTKEVQDAIDIPWKRIAGLRDVAVHRYFGLKMEEVWRVIMRDIPDVQRKISAHLEAIK